MSRPAPGIGACRVCAGPVTEFLDLGRQPSANAFPQAADVGREEYLRLAVGLCECCTMVQLTENSSREHRYPDTYRYQASGSASHRDHFGRQAQHLLETELHRGDPFIVEIGCNDGVMLEAIAKSGVRHLGVEPARQVAAVAAAKGVSVLTEFFDAATATAILRRHGPADVIFGANTICHIDDLGSLLRGVRDLLTDRGIFVFEEPYLGTVVTGMAFDQIYDEHIFYFTVRSVREAATRFGLELINVERLPLHGGEIRYTIARPGARPVTPALAQALAAENAAGLADPGNLLRFADAVRRVRDELVGLLTDLAADGRLVLGYGAPAKATTVTNFCGIGPELVPFVCDSPL